MNFNPGWDSSALLGLLDQEETGAIALRHHIHRNPDLSGYEEPTADAVISALGVDNYDVVAGTGRLVRIGPATGPAIAIRAELDALPIHEESGVAYAATNGSMHACGHDIHLAGAVALGRAALRTTLPVALVLILQPREESYPSGARDILDSGLLDTHQVRSVLGVHVHPDIPVNAVAAGAGMVNAASDEFRITLEGAGGHAAYPHKTADPIVALAQIISAVQGIVSRRTDPMHPTVVSFGSVRSGDAANVIPETATAAGSIRTTDPADRAMIAEELHRIVRLVSEAHRCTGRLEIIDGEPILNNDATLVDSVVPTLRSGGFDVVEPMRSCGSDDFSFYSNAYPGIMMFLGTGAAREGLSLHSPDFCPNDDYVLTVARLYATAFGAIAGTVTKRKSPETIETVTT